MLQKSLLKLPKRSRHLLLLHTCIHLMPLVTQNHVFFPISISYSKVWFSPKVFPSLQQTSFIAPSHFSTRTRPLSQLFQHCLRGQRRHYLYSSVRVDSGVKLEQHKGTVYDFMGATLALIYKQEPSDHGRNHNVRLAWGVPVPSWASKYESRFGHPVKELYGSVEVGLAVTQRGQRITSSCGTA
jgi:hypothetical protein